MNVIIWEGGERKWVGMGCNGNSIDLLHVFAVSFHFFPLSVVMVFVLRDETSLLYLRSTCPRDWFAFFYFNSEKLLPLICFYLETGILCINLFTKWIFFLIHLSSCVYPAIYECC